MLSNYLFYYKAYYFCYNIINKNIYYNCITSCFSLVVFKKAFDCKTFRLNRFNLTFHVLSILHKLIDTSIFYSRIILQCINFSSMILKISILLLNLSFVLFDLSSVLVLVFSLQFFISPVVSFFISSLQVLNHALFGQGQQSLYLWIFLHLLVHGSLDSSVHVYLEAMEGEVGHHLASVDLFLQLKGFLLNLFEVPKQIVSLSVSQSLPDLLSLQFKVS